MRVVDDRAGLGFEGKTRGPPIADTAGGKVATAIQVGGLTSIGGFVWTLVMGLVLIGIPASRRR